MSGLTVRGCTGILKMVPGKNTREIDSFTFYSNMWVDGVFTKRPYFEFSPYSSIKLTYYTSFTHVWSDGSTGLVPAIRTFSHDCYYENKGTFFNG